MFQIGQDTVAIVTDSACDLSDELLARYDVRLVPLRIITSAGEYRDRYEIDQEQLCSLLQTEIPKTSLPLPEDVSAVYQQLREEGVTRILHLSMSGSLSGTYNMISVLAKEAEGLIYRGGDL